MSFVRAPHVTGVSLVGATLVFVISFFSWLFLLVSPVCGIRDNWDSPRYRAFAGFATPEGIPEFNNKFVYRYELHPPPEGLEVTYPPLSYLLKGANMVARSLGFFTFDIRLFSLVYCLTGALCVYGLSSTRGPVTGLFAALFLLQPTTPLGFNSLYVEPIFSLASLVLVTLGASRIYPTNWLLSALFLISFFIGFLKPQLCIFPLLVLITSWRLCKGNVLVSLFLLLLAVSPSVFYLSPSWPGRYVRAMNNLHTVSYGVAAVPGFGLKGVIDDHLPSKEYEYTIGKNFLTLPTPGYLSEKMISDWITVSRWGFALDVVTTSPAALAYGYYKVARAALEPFHRELWVVDAPGPPFLRLRKFLLGFVASIEHLLIQLGLFATITTLVWSLCNSIRQKVHGPFGAEEEKPLRCLRNAFLLFAVLQPFVIIFGDGFFGLDRHVQILQLAGQIVLMCFIALNGSRPRACG